MEIISEKGRTSVVHRVQRGLVCKVPRSQCSEWLLAEINNAFLVERRLLERLGDHCRIIRYFGDSRIKNMDGGLLLGEADGGTLQSNIDGAGGNIDDTLREKWSLQIAEAVAHVHEKHIVHSNLSTANVLVHQGDIVLADFGGSRCRELGLDGQLIPNEPYFDPNFTDFESPKVDVFGLGIILYIINTGHYPFHACPAPENEERLEYEARVRVLFEQGEFPDLAGVRFKDVIAGCCCERRFATAKEVVAAIKAEM